MKYLVREGRVIACAENIVYDNELRSWRLEKFVVSDFDGTEYALQEFPPLPPVPSSITPRQARLALLGAGLLDTVQSAFAQLPDPQRTAASIEWEYATTIERTSPLVSQFGPILGLTEEQIDELFIAAAQL